MTLHSSTAAVGRRHGFALVVTLSLMVLLTIVAVGLLGLASVSLRASSSEQLTREARQNARMALMLAIGELQKATGPDTRVTAPAQVTGINVAQPRLTGVWEGWKWDGTGNPDFQNRKRSQFVRWLTSSRDPSSVTRLDFVNQAASGSKVALVDKVVNSQTGQVVDTSVEAQIVPIQGANTNQTGGYAWAVFDESTKLPTSLPHSADESVTLNMAKMSAAPLPGYAATTERKWGTLKDLAEDRSKLISPSQARLAGLSGADAGFHDITSSSAGVIADAAKGGLAVDLSRLFSDPAALPPEYDSRFLYSGTSTPLASPPSRFSGANPLPSPDPSWRLLHSHYRLYDRLTGGLNPTIDASATERPAAGTTGDKAQNHPFFQTQQLAPVISKAQFVFSLSFGWHTSLTSINANRPPAQQYPYVTWLVVDPVITLWNPYNVNLRFSGGRIDLYRVPLLFRLYRNGKVVNSEFTHFANCFVEQAFKQRANTFYRLNLLPKAGSKEILLAPGEHVVLTAHNHKQNFDFKFSTEGLDLRPGFNPPAGNASKKEVGGASTMNVCVSSSGANNGQVDDINFRVRSVPVRPEDKVQIEVKQGRAAVDKFKETGDKEVTGYLKYYVGNPEKPTLIGGIELDYADNEAEFLPSVPINDLPTFSASSAIPKLVPADSGAAPPPVVRFKEPFLITTFQLKTEKDSKFPSRGWIHNSPTNLYASAGLDQKEPWADHQYELQWEAMTDWPPSSPTIEISSTKDRGYGGPGIYAASGLEFATHSTVPISPALSLAQLTHAPLNTGGQLPLVSQVVANSIAPPVLAPQEVRRTNEGRTLLDHSFFANSALFDQFFFSSLAEPGGPLDPKTSVQDTIKNLFNNNTPLANPRFIPYRSHKSVDEIVDEITGPEGYKKGAAHLLIDSPLNVNNMRVDVWEAYLNSTFGSKVPQTQDGSLTSIDGAEAAFTRHLPSNGASLEASKDPRGQDLAKWNGHRRLTPQQVRRIAEEIVIETQERGPFQSVAEFINRRPDSGPLGKAGALQAALDRAEINKSSSSAISVAGGTTADGAPGVISQADLLTAIAPILTVRGDTFRIRAYGEAGPTNGPKTKAWCEAVVQRLPEYTDTANQPWQLPSADLNRRFGRQYKIISFRWLSPSEV